MLERSDKWYEHSPETVSENTNHKLLWVMNIQCDHKIEARRPDIVIINKVEKSAIIIDAAIQKFMEQIGIELETHIAQKTKVLGTARILRRVLEY